MHDANNLQKAVFEYVLEYDFLPAIEHKWGFSKTKLWRTCRKRKESQANSATKTANDIELSNRFWRRPKMLTKEEEDVVVARALQYADKSTLFTKADILSLTEGTVSFILQPCQSQILFKDGKRTESCLNSLPERHSELRLKPMQTIEDKLVTAVILEHFFEHICRVKEALWRYCIHKTESNF